MATTNIGAGEIFDFQISPLAGILRTKMEQRVNARFAVNLADLRVWDALASRLPSDGPLESGVEAVTMTYTPASLTTPFFVATRAYRVIAVTGREEVAGTGGACTAVIRKAASATAITAGTALHTGTYNLVGSASTNQVLALSATSTDLDIPSGTCIGFHLTGTPTSATGAITVLLAPAASPDDLSINSGTYTNTALPPYVTTKDVHSAGATTKYGRCLIPVPCDFEGNLQTVTIRAFAGMKTTIADTLATLAVEAWRIDADGTYGAANVIQASDQTPKSINSLTAAAKDFVLDSTTILPGDLLDVRITINVTDAATVGAVIGAIWQLELQADLR